MSSTDYTINVTPPPQPAASTLSTNIANENMAITNNWILTQYADPNTSTSSTSTSGTSTSTSSTAIPYNNVSRFEEINKNIKSLNYTLNSTNDLVYTKTFVYNSLTIKQDIDMGTPGLLISKIYGDIGTTNKLVKKAYFINDVLDRVEYSVE